MVAAHRPASAHFQRRQTSVDQLRRSRTSAQF